MKQMYSHKVEAKQNKPNQKQKKFKSNNQTDFVLIIHCNEQTQKKWGLR